MKEKTKAAAASLEDRINNVLENRRLRLSGTVGRLEDVNPLAVIKRGYGMALDGSGKLVSSVKQVKEGDGISVLVADGYINARVEGKKSVSDAQEEK